MNMSMRKLPCKIVQVDEIWTYVGEKEKHVNGTDNPLEVVDHHVFVAMDSETKLVPCFRVGKRSSVNAYYFMQELESRLANRLQLTTDGFPPYGPTVKDAFGIDVDCTQLIKMCAEGEMEKRYSPGE